jgi:hypothetical protein
MGMRLMLLMACVCLVYGRQRLGVVPPRRLSARLRRTKSADNKRLQQLRVGQTEL